MSIKTMYNNIKLINRMEILKNFNSNFQNYDINKNYKKSIYTIEYSNNDETIIYNFLSMNLIVYKNDEFLDIFSKLVEFGFYTDLDTDEYELALNFRKSNTIKFLNKETFNTNIFNSYVILTTSDCNANCFYCFEKGSKRLHMPDKIAEDVANYIIKHYDGESVYIGWFGGEPLYNTKVIDIICDKLIENNISYTGNITSNASLVTEDVLNKIQNKWHISIIQVTFDGIFEEYDKIKKYSDGSSFDSVMNCIESLLKNNCKVSFRLNYNLKNKNSLKEIIDYIYDRFYEKYNNLIQIYSHEIFEFVYSKDEKILNTVYNDIIELNNYIFEKFKLCTLSLFTSPQDHACMADNINGFVINPLGKFTKCEHHIDDNTGEIVGSIYSDEFDIDKINSWKERIEPFENLCNTCPIFPNCYRLKKCYGLNICHKQLKSKLINEYNNKLKEEYYKYKNQQLNRNVLTRFSLCNSVEQFMINKEVE